MNVYPTGLERLDGRQLLIQWSDGRRRRYRVSELREECPCATCRERRAAEEKRPATLLPVLSAQEARPVDIQAMKPVGNYAYNIEFNDGHNAGIFTFELLLSLGSDAVAENEEV
ncbi:MAG: DUF971 domain-containing protein [Planctomycetaceae bacterium]|nr:MAG: DUF971 domain-containing protein [Planctomycetaceae bacterium]